MRITKILDQSKSLKPLTLSEIKVAEAVFKQCFRLKATESVLVVTDPNKLKEATVFFEGAKSLASQVNLIEFTGMSENAQEPPKKVSQAMKESDVVLLVTTYSLSHTHARQQASQAGVRIASLPGITYEMILRTLSISWQAIERESKRLAEILTAGKIIKLFSPAGTDLELSIQGRKALADTGNLKQPGAFGNLPAGEAFIAPQETSTEGKLVIDGALADIKLDQPIEVKIKQGKAVGIKGGKAADKLKAAMDQVGTKTQVVAEFGIGTNPKVKLNPNVLESEKKSGTCHVAFGDNAAIGGINRVSFHSDGILLKPTVIVDGKKLMIEGEVK